MQSHDNAKLVTDMESDEFNSAISPEEKQELMESAYAFLLNAETCRTANFYKKAVLHYKKALQLYKAIDAPFKDIYNCYEKMGICCLELAKQDPKQLIQAKKHFEKAIKHYSSKLGNTAMVGVSEQEQHVHLAYSHEQLLNICLQQQEFDKAKLHALKALNYTRTAYNDNDKRNAICLENLAVCYKALKNYTQAIKYTEGALKLYRQLPDVTETQIQSKEQALAGLRKLNSEKPILATPAQSPSQPQSTSPDYVYGPSKLYSESKPNNNPTVWSMLSSSPLITYSMYPQKAPSSHPAPAEENAHDKNTSVVIFTGTPTTASP